MGMAICMVELTSIARGIETSDDMIKAAQVTLLRGTTVCPGKYMVIVGGETGAVRAALEAGLAKGGEFIVDSLLIPNVHEQLFPAIAGTQEVVDPQAIGCGVLFNRIGYQGSRCGSKSRSGDTDRSEDRLCCGWKRLFHPYR